MDARMGAAQRLGTDFRETDVAHAACLWTSSVRRRFLRSHVGIEAPQAVDVDVVGAEAGSV